MRERPDRLDFAMFSPRIPPHDNRLRGRYARLETRILRRRGNSITGPKISAALTRPRTRAPARTWLSTNSRNDVNRSSLTMSPRAAGRLVRLDFQIK
ncbi:hypothetical protein EVAR_16229_1 [Eumeta japonica]|uniref:Uncharacterized protein n=1 Tax=Eumeta variegata TaxID=151549 RepID=A0A4C1U5V3_EUMVA|nr:hypothetical protein EVAR_16229_1 [Eumeta japonica]